MLTLTSHSRMKGGQRQRQRQLQACHININVNINILSILLLLLLLGPTTQEQECTSTSFRWSPEATHRHPCTITRMTISEFQKRFGEQGLPPLYPHPLVIVASNASNSRNERIRALTQVDHILDSFPPNFAVTLSSSNSFSEHRRTIPFSQYL